MAQWIQCLLCKQEGLRLDLQYPSIKGRRDASPSGMLVLRLEKLGIPGAAAWLGCQIGTVQAQQESQPASENKTPRTIEKDI